jgi:site-specific DNA recombinase
MQQGKVGRARTRGKIVPGRYAPYGFIYDKEAGNYHVDEERMRHVQRLFRMVGSEGATLYAVKHTFQREGVPTPGGGRYWHAGTIREMILNDVYKAHERDELERLTESGNLSTEVLAGLDRNRRYGIAWYNRTRWERTVHGEKAIRVTPNKREDWVAVPVPDAGISREWVDAARAAIKDNVRQSRVDGRSWELKGILFCPCGCRMAPYNSGRGGKRYHYYACSRYRREGPSACEHHKNRPAEALEQAARQFVLELIRDPETLREQVETEVAREKTALRDTRKQLATLAHRLAEADAERDRYNRLYARSKLTDDEYDAYTAETAERKKTAEEELARLEDARRNVEYLDELPRLVEDYLRELPQMIDYMPRIRESTLSDEHKDQLERDRRNGHGLKPYPVVPGTYRKRTPEEMEELRQEAEREQAERYQYMYAKLGLNVVAHKDGTLEFTWKAGKGVSKLCASPRCKAAATTFSSSTLARSKR